MNAEMKWGYSRLKYPAALRAEGLGVKKCLQRQQAFVTGRVVLLLDYFYVIRFFASRYMHKIETG